MPSILLAETVEECHKRVRSIIEHCCKGELDTYTIDAISCAVNSQITRAWDLGMTEGSKNPTTPVSNDIVKKKKKTRCDPTG